MRDTANKGTLSLGGPITLKHLVQFAGASGDFNPLHYDPTTARAAGFEDVVVVGALSASLLITELGRIHDVSLLRYFSVRFLAPVLIAAELDADLCATIDADGVSVVDAVVSANDVVVLEAHAKFDEEASALDTLPEDFVALGDPYRWVVEEGALRQFAAAVGEERRIGPDSIISPTFLPIAMRWSESDRDFVQRLDFDFARIVHGGSTFEYGHDQIRVGEEFQVTEGHSGRKAVQGRSGAMQMADAHLIIRDAEGTVRARVAHRIVERPQK